MNAYGFGIRPSLFLPFGQKKRSQPSECGRQHTLNIVHAQTAAQQQSIESNEARMSGKCGEWRD